MNSQQSANRLAALAVVVLMILTAWGNAYAMVVVSVLGLAGLLIFDRRMRRSGALAAGAGFVAALAIAVVMWLVRGPRR